MGVHLDGKSAGGGRQKVIKQVVKQVVTPKIDVGEIAAAVAQALKGQLNVNVNQRGVIGSGKEFVDNFDNKETLEQLANAMIVQRGNNEANFENLGGVKETKKDKQETDSTIDLLKNLDD